MTKAVMETPSLGVCDFSVVTGDVAETLTYYERLRKYVEHEDGLINSRLTWSLTIHGFLFATYGILLGKVAEILVDLVKLPTASLTLEYGISGLFFLQVPLAAVGILVSHYSREAIVGAHNALQHVYAIAHCSEALRIPPAKTSVPAATGVGEQRVTPGSMAGIGVNSRILVGNDQTSAEVVTVTAVTADTFTAGFVRAHDPGVPLTPLGAMLLPKIIAGGAGLPHVGSVSAYYLKLPRWLMAVWAFFLIASAILGLLSLCPRWWSLLNIA